MTYCLLEALLLAIDPYRCMVRMQEEQIRPIVTFIVPIQSKQGFLVEQISMIFKFSEGYSGLCEIIVTGSIREEASLKLAWLAMKLNKAKHPHVRTKMIRYTSQLDINDLIEISINRALGTKIIVSTDNPEKVKKEKINSTKEREVWITRCIDTLTLKEVASTTGAI